MRKFIAIIGVGRIQGPIPYKNHPGWKDRWQWAVSGRRARDLMALLLPYMGERRRASIEDCLRSQ